MVKEFKMSQARYDELKKELDYSKTTRADEIAELIKEARGFGDLSENSEYDEAKNEQAIVEARIADIEVMSLEYERAFKHIILELQKCDADYQEMLTLLLCHLLIIFHRAMLQEHTLKNEFLDRQMDTAASYFNQNYNHEINIDAYASSLGMSVSCAMDFDLTQSFTLLSLASFKA